MRYAIEPNSEMPTLLYLYWNTEYNWLTTTEHNYWENGGLVSDDGKYYLLDTQPVTFKIGNVDINDIKLNGLEAQLQRDVADSYVRQEKLRQKIQELKCIKHEKIEELLVVEDITPPRPAPKNDFDSFDDDIPF